MIDKRSPENVQADMRRRSIRWKDGDKVSFTSGEEMYIFSGLFWEDSNGYGTYYSVTGDRWWGTRREAEAFALVNGYDFVAIRASSHKEKKDEQEHDVR